MLGMGTIRKDKRGYDSVTGHVLYYRNSFLSIIPLCCEGCDTNVPLKSS